MATLTREQLEAGAERLFEADFEADLRPNETFFAEDGDTIWASRRAFLWHSARDRYLERARRVAHAWGLAVQD